MNPGQVSQDYGPFLFGPREGDPTSVGGFPKVEVPFGEVPTTIISVLGSVLGPPMLGNYHISSNSLRATQVHKVFGNPETRRAQYRLT